MNEVGEAATQEEQPAPDDRQEDEEEPAWLGVLSDEPLRWSTVQAKRGPSSSACVRFAPTQKATGSPVEHTVCPGREGRVLSHTRPPFSRTRPAAQTVPEEMTTMKMKKSRDGVQEWVTSAHIAKPARTGRYMGYFASLEDYDEDDVGQDDGATSDIFVVTEAAESCYTKISAIVDSGAVEHVLPPTYLPRVKMVESPGSKAGKRYLSATGEAIMNLGQKSLFSKMREGQARNITFQVALVRKPLISVAKMCEAGNDIFLTDKPHIMNRATGQVTALRREGKTFVLDLWVRHPTSAASAALAAAATQTATAAAAAVRTQAATQGATAGHRGFSRRAWAAAAATAAATPEDRSTETTG